MSKNNFFIILFLVPSILLLIKIYLDSKKVKIENDISPLPVKVQKKEPRLEPKTCEISVQERRSQFVLIHSPKKKSKRKPEVGFLEKDHLNNKRRQEQLEELNKYEMELIRKSIEADKERKKIISSYTPEDIQRVQERRDTFKLVVNNESMEMNG